jgi:outer membrane protein
MQKLLLFWNILLTIGVLILMLLFFKANKTAGPATEPLMINPTQMQKLQQGAGKIVFINIDSLYTQYEFVKELKKQLEQSQKNKQKELESKYIAFEREVNDFREIAERLSPTEAEKQQMALMEKEQKLIQLREKINNELLTSEAEMNEKLSERINNYLKKYKKQIPFDYVLSFTKGGGILYANDSLDITKNVVKGLNEEYIQQNNASSKK